jgi:hypothetical protein
MFLDRRKRRIADVVFHLAGIVCCGLFIYAEPHQDGGQDAVPFIDAFRSVFSGVCQRNVPIRVDRDIAAAFQDPNRAGSGRLSLHRLQPGRHRRPLGD